MPKLRISILFLIMSVLTLLLFTVLIRSSEFSAVAFLLLIMFIKSCVHVGMQMQMCFPVSFVRNDTYV